MDHLKYGKQDNRHPLTLTKNIQLMVNVGPNKNQVKEIACMNQLLLKMTLYHLPKQYLLEQQQYVFR